MEIVFL